MANLRVKDILMFVILNMYADLVFEGNLHIFFDI